MIDFILENVTKNQEAKYLNNEEEHSGSMQKKYLFKCGPQFFVIDWKEIKIDTFLQ
jgi:hypothetical protein